MLVIAAVGGCSESVPTGNPAELLSTEMRGYEAPIGVMMGLNEKPYWVQSAVAGFRAAENGDMPAKVENLRFSGGCTFTAPKPDEILANVQVDGSQMGSVVHVVSRETMGERTKTYIENYKVGHDVVPLSGSDDRMGIVDVVVTEKTKPVYLVIAYSSPTIFNIQLAEGASLSHIALVGFGAAGIANVDPSVPIEVLIGKAMQLCNVTPVRQPADHWQFVQNAKEDPGLKDVLAKNFSMYNSFSSWYRQNFGVSSGPDAIGAASASHVLVGPLPETLEARVNFKSLEGVTLLLSKSDYVYVGTDANYMQKFTDLIIESATKLAGGDLTKLKPAQ